MLILRWDSKIGKDQCNDENVIHRKREFDDVASEKFQRVVSALKRNEESSETQRKKGQNGGPGKGLLKFYYRSLPMKHSQVQGQKDQDTHKKSCPMQRCDIPESQHRASL